MRRVVAVGLLTAALVQGCAPMGGSAPYLALSDAPRPKQADCPGVAHVDLAAVARDGITPERLARINDRLSTAIVPDTATRRPPPDAPFVIRVREPSGGMSGWDGSSVVWREADGSWWFWIHRYDGLRPPPPPPPPRPGTPEEAAYRANPPRSLTPAEATPPREGRLYARAAEMMEAARLDACRGWDPDRWPYDLPLRRPDEGRRTYLCPPDGGPSYAEITEAGRPPRPILIECNNRTPTALMVSIAESASAEPPS